MRQSTNPHCVDASIDFNSAGLFHMEYRLYLYIGKIAAKENGDTSFSKVNPMQLFRSNFSCPFRFCALINCDFIDEILLHILHIIY